MTFAHKKGIFKRERKKETDIIMDLLLSGTAYLEDVLLVESTEIEN